MTSFPADRLSLADRGRIKPGMKADLVVFHPNEIIDHSTMTQPMIEPTGVAFVLINGIPVVDAGNLSGARPGKSIRHAATR
jgi:N-acyl-D-aspartate/D-glutamate deacylase